MAPFSASFALLLGVVQGVAAANESNFEFALYLFSDLAPALPSRFSAVLSGLFPVCNLQQRLEPLQAALDKYMYLVSELPMLQSKDFDEADEGAISEVDPILQFIFRHKELVGEDGRRAIYEELASPLERLKEAARILKYDGNLEWKKPKLFISEEMIPSVMRSKLAVSDEHASA
ncbi:hypothetical protein B0H67DRAFT_648020 [Lasiosphaeris hirsuta]|uniref:Uncharacterized protein n=1 Tax=Lasiosphaeris hirsuta TaxID=260670 RepID=A0AA40DNP7_9PEZI|nr:hypothetical protein B0H67DRAFT_648020 [Lasiosphaeris hirsuta]